MEIHIRHRFERARREDVEALYLVDEAFNRAAFARIDYQRDVLVEARDGDRLRRVLRVHGQHALPRPFGSLAPAGFHFDEHTEYDFARHRGMWKTVPSVLSHQFGAEGTFEIVEAGKGAVEVRFDGAARASIPLVGRAAERAAVTHATRSHAALAAAVREELARRERRHARERSAHDP